MLEIYQKYFGLIIISVIRHDSFYVVEPDQDKWDWILATYRSSQNPTFCNTVGQQNWSRGDSVGWSEEHQQVFIGTW